MLRRSPKLRSFVTDGGPDVFVHISAVERAGMSNLNEKTRLGVPDDLAARHTSLLTAARYAVPAIYITIA